MKSLTKKPLLYYSVLITLISALLLCSCRSNKAIEETAGIILDIMKENGLKIYKDSDK